MRLVVTARDGRTRSLDLAQLPVLEIGSVPGGDGAKIVLRDAEIAPSHLKLYREDGRVSCYDLSGRGFLFRGQHTLQATLAADGDTVVLGSFALRLATDGAAAPPMRTLAEEPTLRERRPADTEAAGAGGAPTARLPAPAPGGRATLTVIRGKDEGRVFPLHGRATTLAGRGATSDVPLWDIRASRVHCRIDREQDGTYRISDLSSSNGTYVNGSKIHSQPLHHGDVVRIGQTQLQFSSG